MIRGSFMFLLKHMEQTAHEAGAIMMTEHVIPLGFPALMQHDHKPGNFNWFIRRVAAQLGFAFTQVTARTILIRPLKPCDHLQ